MTGYCGMTIPDPPKKKPRYNGEGCTLIAWSPTKDGVPRPNCPQCGGPGELDSVMGIKIGYFHKQEHP